MHVTTSVIFRFSYLLKLYANLIFIICPISEKWQQQVTTGYGISCSTQSLLGDTVKKIMAPKDFRTEILEGITSRCMSGPKQRRMLQVATASKEVTLGEHAGVAKPAKEEAVIKQQTRFAVSTTIQPRASKLIRLISSDMEIGLLKIIISSYYFILFAGLCLLNLEACRKLLALCRC